MNIIIMVGLPASGKTTYIKNNLSDYTVVSADDVREDLYGDAAIQGNIKDVFDKFYERLGEALNTSENIVVDNTSVKAKYRRNLEDFIKIRCKANGTKYDVRYIFMETPVSMCLKRNRARDRKVPEHIIMAMNLTLHKDFQDIANKAERVKA